MIVFDTETTGLPKPSSVPLEEQPKIIEFAAIKLDNKTLKETDRVEFLLNPEEKLDPVITKITGLKDEDLIGQPLFVEQYPLLADFFLGEREMVAHYVAFDRSLLEFDLRRIDKLMQFPWPIKHTCTVEASYPLKNFRLKLTQLHEIVTGSPHKEAHRAMADVEALATCVRWLRKKGMM